MNELRSISVLLVEDEAGDAYLVKTTLKQNSDITFNVQWVESLELAKQALAISHFDVMLLDLSLSDSQGLNTIKFARKIDPEIPIIVLTGRVDIDFALTSLKAGASDYILKDIVQSSINTLSRVIRYALLRVELEKNNQLLSAANLSLDLLHSLDHTTIISETNLNGEFTFVNSEFCRVSGYSAAELLGTTPKIVSSGVHSKEFYLRLWSTIKSGRVWSGEICNLNKAGKKYWMQTIILPVHPHNSEGTYFYKYAMVGLDITEKKNHEMAMEQRAALYEAAIETTDGFCRISSSGNFLEVSDGYCKLSGYSREELLNMNILKMAGDFALSLQQFSQIIQGNGKTFETQQHRKDGSLWIAEITASYCSTLNDSSVFVFLRDITQQMEMQKRDRILRDQLIQMQKIDSIGRLTAGIGHDFNNILTSILGFNEMNKIIIDEDIQDENIKMLLDQNLEHVAVAGKRAVELIAKMMNYCRQNTAPVEIEQIELKKPTRKIIEEVVEMVRAGLPKKITIELDLNDTPPIFIDPIDLHQIMTNLLVNARDAMKSNGGVIKVKLAVVNILTYPCAACLKPVEGGLIELSVSDSGTGIDKKVIEKIFDPFFTTKAVGEGTGLGLSTVSGIVHHAHGHILIDSVLSVGTTFRLLFQKDPMTEKG
ncbi:MAG: PAS domain S-box protein [Methylococcales bacterium]|nr:PAS domain S-box protein [Methylococcales bacterium]